MSALPPEAPPQKETTPLAWILLILLAFIWGSSFLLMTSGLLVFTPIQVASLRIVAASVSLVGIALPAFWRIPRQKWGLTFVSGMLGVFIPAFLFAYAIQHTGMAVAGILNAMTPIFTLLVAVLFFQQKAELNKWIGMGIGFLGSVILALASSQDRNASLSIYPFLILLATICYALNGNLSKQFMQGISPMYLTAMSQFWIGILAVVVLLNSDIQTQWDLPTASRIVDIPLLGISGQARWVALISLLFLGLSSTAIAMVIFNRLMQMVNVMFASTVTYLIPLVAMSWHVVGGGTVSWLQISCMVLIVGGVYVANSTSQKLNKKN